MSIISGRFSFVRDNFLARPIGGQKIFCSPWPRRPVCWARRRHGKPGLLLYPVDPWLDRKRNAAQFGHRTQGPSAVVIST